jgi:hypothetical protein
MSASPPKVSNMPAVPKNRTSAALNRQLDADHRPPEAEHVDELTALRDRLAAAIEAGPPPSSLAALGRELRATLAELAALVHADGREHRARLQHLIVTMRASMDDTATSAAAVAALGREVRAALAEIAALPDPDAGPDLVEQLRERRRLRLEASRADLAARQAAEARQA